MGINAVLQDEKCNSISEIVIDHNDIITHFMPKFSDNTYTCVRFIDPYGDTIFNHLQAAVILEEWDKLHHSFVEQNAEALWADIRELIVRCLEEPHTYIRFIGN